jgi:RHH-type proline utilization regulon transcriptional repressor/proline dehydrogenase/delta 1-pyrroline-5-carboxylate dehydrogenase
MRADTRPGLMEVFLAEYGLSTEEGVALMCLAEALLRVPDADTVDALIEDKIAPSEWGAHLGRSSSPLVNASTWALMLTGRSCATIPEPGVAATLRGAVKRLGEPVIRTAVRRAMREMGNQFVLGEDIGAAMARARRMEAKGYTYSYDMLGEAALTAADAARFFDAYAAPSRGSRAPAGGRRPRTPASRSSSRRCIRATRTRRRPGHGRAGAARQPAGAQGARDAGIGISIDAEEADRLTCRST